MLFTNQCAMNGMKRENNKYHPSTVSPKARAQNMMIQSPSHEMCLAFDRSSTPFIPALFSKLSIIERLESHVDFPINSSIPRFPF